MIGLRARKKGMYEAVARNGYLDTLGLAGISPVLHMQNEFNCIYTYNSAFVSCSVIYSLQGCDFHKGKNSVNLCTEWALATVCLNEHKTLSPSIAQ